jgi:hypothetical protein
MPRALPSPRPAPPRLGVERLEDRATPAANATGITAVLNKDGTLIVEGTNGPDQIVVTQLPNGNFTVDGVNGSFVAKDVHRLEVHGNGGDDYIQFTANYLNRKHQESFRDLLEGGDGDDTIVGSALGDRVYGGAGNDLIDGGAGNDMIYGGDGNDTLLGGDGSDYLSGGAGDDDLWGEDGADFLDGGTGNDTFQGGAGRNAYRDVFDPTQWAANGYQPQDVQQGTGGTCSILSTLAAAAATNNGTSLAGRISYVGNNIYDVTLNTTWLWGLFHTTDTERVYFDGTWYDHDAQPAMARDANGSPTGPPNGDFWALLYQRAVLQEEGMDWSDPKSIESYSATEGSMHEDILDGASTYTVDNSTSPTDVRDALRAGAIVTAGTPDYGKDAAGNPIDEKDGIVGSHAYAVIDVYQNNGEWRVKLYNPWGWDGIVPATDGHDDGMIDISWNTFTSHFDDYCRTDV